MADHPISGEFVGEEPVARLTTTVRGALRRKVDREAQIAGSLTVLAPYSRRLLEVLVDAVDTLAGRASFERPLHAAGVRAAARLAPDAVAPVLARALQREDAGGLATLSAAGFVHSPALVEPLARVAASRHPLLAFAAEVARVARGESHGERIVAIAPKIKESHRIALCTEIFVPLLHGSSLPQAVAPALEVLRGAERHLGRWLLLGEVATRAGDPVPLAEALERATSGPSSARAAWSFVAWALAPSEATLPAARPTVEVIARLSDQPSGDKDATFLFRLAEAGAPMARPMLEALLKGVGSVGSGLGTGQAVRAALYLVQHYGRADLLAPLRETAASKRSETVRGLAAAALSDLGAGDDLSGLAAELVSTRHLPTIAWGGLVRAAQAAAEVGPLITEARYRQVQLGWAE